MFTGTNNNVNFLRITLRYTHYKIVLTPLYYKILTLVLFTSSLIKSK